MSDKPILAPKLDDAELNDAAKKMHDEERLEEALEESFPASDPIAITIDR